jgi:hypothetical protein
MIILRQPSEFPITLQYEGLSASTEYSLRIYSTNAVLLYEYDVTSDGNGTISQELDQYFEKFDDEYAVNVFSLDGEGDPEDTSCMDNLSIKRPYVNPYLLEIPQKKMKRRYTMKELLGQSLTQLLVDSITHMTP